jgi:hypothetical protein
MYLLEDHPVFRRTVGCLLLILAVAVLGFLLFAMGRDLSLWVFGRTVTAEIVERWAEPVGDPGAEELAFRYYIRYHFRTADGKDISSVKRVAAQEWIGVGYNVQGRAAVDEYDGEAEGPMAPVYREQEHVSETSYGGLVKLQQVDVVYFPLFPAHNRLEESRLVPILACTYLPFLLVGGGILLAARSLLRAREAADRWAMGNGLLNGSRVIQDRDPA